jgi:hypothetical protein
LDRLSTCIQKGDGYISIFKNSGGERGYLIRKLTLLAALYFSLAIAANWGYCQLKTPTATLGFTSLKKVGGEIGSCLRGPIYLTFENFLPPNFP